MTIRRKGKAADTAPFRVITLKNGRHQVIDANQKNRGTWPATPAGKALAEAHCAALLKNHGHGGPGAAEPTAELERAA